MTSSPTIDFNPTPESIPPPGYRSRLHLKVSPELSPVNRHALNPLSFLLRYAERYPDEVALSHLDTKHPVRYTYSVWSQRVLNLTHALINEGIGPGDRVAVVAPNTPMMCDAIQAALAARAIITPINIRLKQHEVTYILNLPPSDHSETKLLLIDSEFLHLIEGNSLRIPYIVCNDTGGQVQGDPYEDFLRKGREVSDAKGGWPSLDKETNEDAGCVLSYTSGTTGRPKGVLFTLRGTCLAALGNAFEMRIKFDSTYLWVLPLFHAAGWTIPWSLTFASASQITIRSVDYSVIWKHFMNSGVTHYCAAPTVQIGIANCPSAKRVPRKITTMVGGSAPTSTLLGSLEQLGIRLVHIYGLTETHGPATNRQTTTSLVGSTLEDRSRYMSKQGTAIPLVDCVRVVLPILKSGNQSSPLVDVPWDGKTMGEIVMRGNLVMKEYFKDPIATAEAFQGGFFHSGDLAVVYPDGAISVVDRSKDMIISGGENASSLAIEQELATHPSILEISVVARAHPKWGERPMAFVVLRPGIQETAEEFEKALIQYAKERLPGFARPEWVKIVHELPKNATGKVLKVELRKVVAKL